MEFGVGSIVEGKVTGITKFGAFVSLPGGRSGLVHISEIAYSYVNDVKDHLTEGQEVKVKVIGIDDNNRINLSIKKAMDPPPRPQRTGGPGSPRQGGAPRSGGFGGPRQGGGRSFSGPRQPSEPETFEERLKHFMQASESRISDSRAFGEKRSSKRRGR